MMSRYCRRRGACLCPFLSLSVSLSPSLSLFAHFPPDVSLIRGLLFAANRRSVNVCSRGGRRYSDEEGGDGLQLSTGPCHKLSAAPGGASHRRPGLSPSLLPFPCTSLPALHVAVCPHNSFPLSLTASVSCFFSRLCTLLSDRFCEPRSIIRSSAQLPQKKPSCSHGKSRSGPRLGLRCQRAHTFFIRGTPGSM